MFKFRWVAPLLILFISCVLVLTSLFVYREKKHQPLPYEATLIRFFKFQSSPIHKNLEDGLKAHASLHLWLGLRNESIAPLMLKFSRFLEMVDQAIKNPQTNTVLNEYYLLKQKSIAKAGELIQKIVVHYPQNLLARKEYGYLLLEQNKTEKALKQFLYVHYKNPNDEQITLQIAYLYDKDKNRELEKKYFTLLLKSKDAKKRKTAASALKNIQIQQTNENSATYSLLTLYYKIKAKDPDEALQLITQVVELDANNAQAQGEMGYLLLSMKRRNDALIHLICAYELNPDNAILANEIGFIYDFTGNKKEARKYFRLAAGSLNTDINKTANIALINLSDWTFKILPRPLFVDYYTEPFYQSRFNDFIFPQQRRVGVFVGDHTQLQLYGSYRETRDSRSLAGIAPQIFTDNVKIWALGTRYYPFSNIGLFGYIEYGDAYDIVYRNRNRWRDDLRGGVVVGQYWGVLPDYSKQALFEFKSAGDFYGDVSYYSRYDNNIIGQLRLRQGARIFRWKNTTVHVYVKGQYFFDTNHEFYNNVVEYGPGIAFTPFNQIDFTLRAEHLFGHYIPVHSPTPNPYGSHYQTNIVLAEIYLLF